MGAAMRSVKESDSANISDVRQMITAGTTIPTAIKEALSKNGVDTVTAFADKHSLNRSAVSNHLSGSVRATDDTVAALVAELGGTPDEWRELLWLAAKPTTSAAWPPSPNAPAFVEPDPPPNTQPPARNGVACCSMPGRD